MKNREEDSLPLLVIEIFGPWIYRSWKKRKKKKERTYTRRGVRNLSRERRRRIFSCCFLCKYRGLLSIVESMINGSRVRGFAIKLLKSRPQVGITASNFFLFVEYAIRGKDTTHGNSVCIVIHRAAWREQRFRTLYLVLIFHPPRNRNCIISFNRAGFSSVTRVCSTDRT